MTLLFSYYRMARKKLEKSKQKPQDVFGSYISSRDTGAAERALMR